MKKHEAPKYSIVVLSKKSLPNCVLELVVSVPLAFMILCQEKTIDRIIKTVSLPGFRKGRVPRSHVLKTFEQKISLEWQESLAKQVAQDTVEELGLRIIPPVVYSWKKLDKGFDAELQLSVEVYPETVPIENLDFPSLSAPIQKSITEEDIENKLTEYKNILSDWSTLELEGDILLEKEDRISYCLLSEGKEVFREKDQLLKKIDPSLQEIFLGMKEKEKEVTFSQEIVSCPPGIYQLNLLQVDRKNLPILDEAFAQRFKLQSMDEVRNEIRKRLQSSLEFDSLEEAKSVLQDFLAEKLSFELPLSLLEKEVESRSNFASNQQLTKEEVQKQAGQALRLFFFIESIAVQNQIQLTQEHRDFIWSQNSPGPQGENGRQRMAAQLMQHEVLLFLLQRIGWIKPS